MDRDTLRSLATRNCDNPSVVLLTPGPYNETFFEHDYLARYLGFTLVEGGDLTVRDRKVFLKTLEGLRPIDVILRRVDDTFCDPLEFRGDSVLGVPGLVEAVRAGNVTMANALGTGLLESAAFMAFLPGLCRHLLGEELKLPSLATWWCGQEKEKQYVIDHLDEIVVKPAFGSRLRQPFFGSRMEKEEREQLVASILRIRIAMSARSRPPSPPLRSGPTALRNPAPSSCAPTSPPPAIPSPSCRAALTRISHGRGRNRCFDAEGRG